MSREQNKMVALSWYSAFDRGDLATIEPMLARNFRGRVGRQLLDRSAVIQLLGMFLTAFSDSKHSFEHVIVEGDRVVTVGTWSGTHTGDFQGIPATGRSVVLPVFHIDTISNGKIVEHNGEGDFLGLLLQLGRALSPADSRA